MIALNIDNWQLNNQIINIQLYKQRHRYFGSEYSAKNHRKLSPFVQSF